MRTLKKAALAAALLGTPIAVLAQGAPRGSIPSSGYSTGAVGWQYPRRGRRSLQASGAAVAGLILAAAAASSIRRR